MENAQILADKIARLLRSETPNADCQSLQESLEKINQRLDRLESQIAFQNPGSQIPNPKSNHSSQEKFADLEELAGVDKACPYEPAGKPCDHCAMCDSRGF